MKKIGIVAFTDYDWDFLTDSNKDRLQSLAEIADYSNENNITHIVFPGSTLFYTKRNINLAKKHIEVLKKLFKNQCIIAELNCNTKPNISPFGVYAIEKGEIVNSPISQILVTSSEDYELYKKLWNEIFNTRNRILNLGGIRFLIMICGEINLLKNNQAQNNKVFGLRYDFGHKKSINDLDYDIFVNPTHHMLTNLYNKYKERLKYLTKNGKYGVISLNVSESQIQRNGAIMLFKNKKEILNKENKKRWHGEPWVMEEFIYVRE